MPLGETEGKSLITPVDLVEQGSSSSRQVVSTARFLQGLDQDADPSNGITISQDVQMRAQDWELDLNSDDFDQQLESIKSDLEEEYESFSGFPNEITARNHLESTLRCSYSGAYEPPQTHPCLLYTSPSPRDRTRSRMPSSA